MIDLKFVMGAHILVRSEDLGIKDPAIVEGIIVDQGITPDLVKMEVVNTTNIYNVKKEYLTLKDCAENFALALKLTMEDGIKGFMASYKGGTGPGLRALKHLKNTATILGKGIDDIKTDITENIAYAAHEDIKALITFAEEIDELIVSMEYKENYRIRCNFSTEFHKEYLDKFIGIHLNVDYNKYRKTVVYQRNQIIITYINLNV